MTEKEILKNNRLIQSFMGKDDEHRFLFDQLNTKALYHLSWDWLIPVVEKIETISCNEESRKDAKYIVTIEEKYCVISAGGEQPVCECQGEENKIDSVYKCIVEFINLYNDNE